MFVQEIYFINIALINVHLYVLGLLPAIWNLTMKTYLELLEESLPPKGHPQREKWREYALSGEQRAQEPLDYISGFAFLEGAVLLDLGCSDGGFTLAAQHRGCQVVGLELSTANIRRAQARVVDASLSAFLVQGSGLQLPFPADTFDIIILQDVIEHVPNPLALLEQCFRVAKSGGICYISAVNILFPGYILSDPHWGLFGVSLMPHWLGKLYVCRIRKMSANYDVWYLPNFIMIKNLLHRTGFRISGELDQTPKHKQRSHLMSAVIRCVGVKP